MESYSNSEMSDEWSSLKRDMVMEHKQVKKRFARVKNRSGQGLRSCIAVVAVEPVAALGPLWTCCCVPDGPVAVLGPLAAKSVIVPTLLLTFIV